MKHLCVGSSVHNNQNIEMNFGFTYTLQMSGGPAGTLLFMRCLRPGATAQCWVLTSAGKARWEKGVRGGGGGPPLYNGKMKK